MSFTDNRKYRTPVSFFLPEKDISENEEEELLLNILISVFDGIKKHFGYQVSSNQKDLEIEVFLEKMPKGIKEIWTFEFTQGILQWKQTSSVFLIISFNAFNNPYFKSVYPREKNFEDRILKPVPIFEETFAADIERKNQQYLRTQKGKSTDRCWLDYWKFPEHTLRDNYSVQVQRISHFLSHFPVQLIYSKSEINLPPSSIFGFDLEKQCFYIDLYEKEKQMCNELFEVMGECMDFHGFRDKKYIPTFDSRKIEILKTDSMKK